MKKLISCLLCLCLILYFVPRRASASAMDLSGRISNRSSRRYVEAMLGYHLRENEAVKKTLEDGYAALFLFEGCSDNMDDPELSDLSYYRVSAVCIALRLDEAGEPYIAYFNEDCSTLPDRPLEYGKWHLEEVGDVGPATVCDGTYELYSVYHAGAYEALHIRTGRRDGTLSAVYMTPQGYVTSRATEVNIHTRTGNHTIEGAMWSAGCMLVGDGEFEDFSRLVEATYYGNYRVFYKSLKAGTLTIDRQNLRQEMQALYRNADAVEALLKGSTEICPEMYLEQCGDFHEPEEELVFSAVCTTDLMTLPCANETDARSVQVLRLYEDDRVGVTGTVVNPQGELWYRVELLDGPCYLKAVDAQQVPQTLWERIVDFFR